MTGRERVLATIHGETVDRLAFMPITMMFAADYAGVPYLEYVTDHRRLVEAQMRTTEEFDLDYVSCISDPAREAADCGAEIEFFPNQPPAIRESAARLADQHELLTLALPDPYGGGRMHDRVLAAALFKHKVHGEKLIEGWIEGPCAEAADLRGINKLMMDFYEDPAFVYDLFEFVIAMELQFAKAQVEAGVDIIGIGDAAASLIGPQIYEEFVHPYEKKLVDGLHDLGVPVRLHICGNTTAILDGMGRLGCEIVDLDFMVSISAARKVMGPRQVLLGNVEPAGLLRNGTARDVYEAVAECHRQAGNRYIVSAGCEVPRDTPRENVQAMGAYVRGSARPN